MGILERTDFASKSVLVMRRHGMTPYWRPSTNAVIVQCRMVAKFHWTLLKAHQ